MIKKLLTFSRKDSVSRTTFSMNDMVEETVLLARRGFSEDVELSCDVSEQNLTISGDVSLLEQVILNLLNHAYAAVVDTTQPQINCHLSPWSADALFSKAHPELADKELMLLEISDNGCGISAHDLSSIFEPFFTTKEVGKGTGLGLSMAYGAIQNHGGIIDVSSVPGEGCTFRIYLPVSKEVGLSSAEKFLPDAVAGAGEVILLVDDHKDIRDSSAEVLESLDYQVILAEDGEQAVALFNANRDKINLIVTDIVMPKISGVEAVRRIRASGSEVLVAREGGVEGGGVGRGDGGGGGGGGRGV